MPSALFRTSVVRRAQFRAISAVDLFCGAGGLAHGFSRAGIPVTAGFDTDYASRFPFEKNNAAKFYLRDVSTLIGEEVSSLYPPGDIKVLAGCAPCQPFSSYTQHRDSTAHTSWGLLYSFGRIVGEVLPEFVTMENVPKLRKHEVYSDFVSELKGYGYYVVSYDVNTLNYGVPQTRTRLVLLASRIGPIRMIQGTHSASSYLTVRQAIADLEPLTAGSCSPTDRLHRASRLSPTNLRRIRASRPGGTWKDWDKSLVAECHTKATGRTYASVYGRMVWDKPSPTITTLCYGFGNGRFGHPQQDRAISLREAAILQSFPRDYEFVSPGDPVEFRKLGRLIGNAVPVRLAEAIALSILQHSATSHV